MNTLTATAQSASAKKFTVTIDAGHGGHDTGAQRKNSAEKNIALAIALKSNGLWSDDSHFFKQDKIKVFRTSEMLKLIDSRDNFLY